MEVSPLPPTDRIIAAAQSCVDNDSENPRLTGKDNIEID